MAANNTVEATLRSRYEDGIERGIENTRRTLTQAFSQIHSASGVAAVAATAAWEQIFTGFDRLIKFFKRGADESEGSFRKMGFLAGAFAVTMAGELLKAAKAVTDFIVEVVRESSAMFETRSAFDAVTAAANVQSDVLLKRLKVATEGQVSSITNMRNAIKVLGSEIPITTEQFVRLTANVFALAKSQGKDAVAAQDALALALIKGNSRALGPAIGVHLQVKDAVNEMADAMNTSGAKLADRTKMQVFYNELLERTTMAVERQGKSVVSLEDIMTLNQATWKGFIVQTGVAIQRAGVFQELMGRLSRTLLDVSISGEKQRAVSLAVNDALIDGLRLFAKLIDLITAFGPLLAAFYSSIKAMLAAFAHAGAYLVDLFVNLFGVVTLGLSYLPGQAGKAFGAVSGWLKELHKQLGAFQTYTHDAFEGSFDNFGSNIIKLEDLSAGTKRLAKEMEGLRLTIFKNNAATGDQSDKTAKAAGDQKALNDQLQKYRDLLGELSVKAATPANKDLLELEERNRKITQDFDKIGAEKRTELYNASYQVYLEAVRKGNEGAARQQAEALEKELTVEQQRFQSISQLRDQLYSASASDEEKARLQHAQALARINEVTLSDDVAWMRLTELANRQFDAEMAKIRKARADKEKSDAVEAAERRRKQLDDLVRDADAIQRTVAMVQQRQIPIGMGKDALDASREIAAKIRVELGTLTNGGRRTAEDIEHIERLKQALNGLNRIKLDPFRSALQSMKDQVMDFAGQAGQAIAGFFEDWASGQDHAGKRLIAAFLGMIGQMLVHTGVMLMQAGVAEIAMAHTLIGRLMGASTAAGVKAIATGVALAAVGGLLAGAAKGMTNASPQSASGGGSASNTQQAVAPQPIIVGSPRGSQTPLPPQKIELEIRSNDSHIVRVVKGNATNNGELRSVFVTRK